MTRVTGLDGKFIGIHDVGDMSSTKKIIGFDNSNPRHKNYQMECLSCRHTQWTSVKAFNKKCKRCGSWQRLGGRVAGARTVTPPERQLWNKYKHHSKDRNIDFDISEEIFSRLVGEDCFYCGKPPSQIMTLNRRHNNTLIYNGVDRKINSVGYTEDNCVACCWTCNQAKKNYDLPEWKNMVLKWSRNVNEW